MSIVNEKILENKNFDYSNSIWVSVLSDFEKEFGQNIYKAWISNLHLVSLAEFEIVMSVPTAFIRDWINKEFFNGQTKTVNGEKIWFKKGIKQLLLERFPKLVSFEIIVDKSLNNNILYSEKDEVTNGSSDLKSLNNIDNVLSISVNNNLYNIGTELNKNYTFENFVVGQSNKLAYQVAKNISENKDLDFDFNPLFIYGSVGLGKTHLCQAIAWKLREKNPNKQIVYLSAEKFMFLFVQSLQNQDINSFKNKFRHIDTLIIDDIHFIAGKDKTQKEFFYTFDTLMNDKKQIILACDRSPSNLEYLDEKLKSRMNGGLIVDIKEPDYQLRFDLIKKKSEQLGLRLTKDLMEFIAEKVTSNGREIEGCLKRLQINQNIMQIDIGKTDIEEILFDNIIQTQKLITIDLIQEKVVECFNISMSDLKSEKRIKGFVIPRHVAMYLCKKLTTKSFPDIAKKFNGKNHATVIHAVKKIEDLIETDVEISKIVTKLTNSLK